MLNLAFEDFVIDIQGLMSLWTEKEKNFCLILVNYVKVLHFVKISDGGLWPNFFFLIHQ